MAVNQWLWMPPILLVIAGIAMTVSNTSANALLLAAAPAQIRGEAIGLYMLAMRGGVAVGGLVTGLLVGLIGVRSALFINGARALTAHVVIGRLWQSSAVVLRQPEGRSSTRADRG